MDFDELFTELGDYGRYQQLMLWFVLFPAQLPYLCQVYCHLFMSITPDHWCKVSLLDHLNVTENFSRHLFVPKKNNVLHSLEYEQCSAYNISYETLLMQSKQIGWIPNQTWPITKCTEGWVYNRSLLGNDHSIVTKVSDFKLLFTAICLMSYLFICLICLIFLICLNLNLNLLWN